MTDNTTPIKPSDVPTLKAAGIPAQVIQVFNELIVRNWDGFQSMVRQSEAVGLVASRMNISKGEAYDKHYLDVEDAFRAEGWEVTYDKPGYNETYEPTFRFKAKATPRS